MARRSTSTSAFGVSKRESHDATGFYRRFTPPDLSSEAEIADIRAVDKLIVGDARYMEEVPDSSVALVVTSPPYFAGKEYEEALGVGGVPATYLEYLDLLRDVFAQCIQKLEPGGRIAVNVANLGRRPYRSLSSDVIGILQDDLRLLLRGEIIWLKQRGSSGSCAWGSFQRPGNPVLRDLTERVIIASKGRFDRALPAKARAQRALPSEASITRDDFMENTLDVWEIPAESATRVGHPAPFPVELPARLIDLYTYRGDLVLDPFSGSGTTAVAAVRTGRHYAGYDLDESYVRLAETRVEQERQRLERQTGMPKVTLPAASGTGVTGTGVTGTGVMSTAGAGETPAAQAVSVGPAAQETVRAGGGGRAAKEIARAVGEGRAAKEIARSLIERAGFADVHADQRQPGGIDVSFTARDSKGKLWLFDVAGTFSSYRSGLKRSETLWKALGKAAVLHASVGAPLVVLTTDAPARGTGAEALKQVVGAEKPIRAVIEILEPPALGALQTLAKRG